MSQCHFNILFADGICNVGGCQSADRQFVRIQPDSHAVIPLPKHSHLTHPRHAAELILQMQSGIIAEIQLVVATIRTVNADLQQNVGGPFASNDSGASHNFRQSRQGQTNAILNQNLRQIQIDSGLEGNSECVRAVVGAGRIHVQHVFHAVHFLFDRSGDGFCDSLSTGAGIVALHFHRGRSNLGVLCQGQTRQRDAADHRYHDGNHGCKNGTINKEMGTQNRPPTESSEGSAWAKSRELSGSISAGGQASHPAALARQPTLSYNPRTGPAAPAAGFPAC